jgi:hypothetical protein
MIVAPNAHPALMLVLYYQHAVTATLAARKTRANRKFGEICGKAMLETGHG